MEEQWFYPHLRKSLRFVLRAFKNESHTMNKTIGSSASMFLLQVFDSGEKPTGGAKILDLTVINSFKHIGVKFLRTFRTQAVGE
jgi:hypothetical protein